MLILALQTLRARRSAAAGTFVALAFAVALLTACGILVQTGLDAGAPVDRYAAAPIVVAGPATMRDPGGVDVAVRLPEPARVPLVLVPRLAAVEGVRSVVVDRAVPVTLAGGAAVTAHGWSSAALAPYALTSGRAPSAAGEIVLGSAAGAARVGERVRVLTPAGAQAFTVVGVARPPRGQAGDAVFVSDDEAARLVIEPARADALGVLLDDGARTAAVAARVRDAVGDRRRVLTGDARGQAASRDVVQGNEDLISLGGAFGSFALLLAVFVVAGTLGLAVLQRGREIALLRAIGAKPRQVKMLLLGEAIVISGAAGIAGVVPGVLLASGLFEALRDRGVAAETTTLVVGPAPPVIAVAIGAATACMAAWLAGRRAAQIRPTAALGEAALEPRRVGPVRAVAGLLVLAGGAALCLTAMSQQGDAAVEAAVGVVMTLMVAIALLGPLLAAAAAALAGPVMARLSPASGFLAQARLRTRARRFAAASTPLALAVAFTVAVIGTISVETHATEEQSRERVVADRTLSAPNGLPGSVLDEVRATPGIGAATGLLAGEVGLLGRAFDGPVFAFHPAVGISSGEVAGTLELDVRRGSLAELGPGTVALGAERARSLRADIGDRVTAWMPDSRVVRLRVVAVYGSTLGFGELVVAREQLARHVANPLYGQALVTFGAGGAEAAGGRLRALLARTPGARVADQAGFRAAQAEARETNAWVNYLILGVLMAFCAVAVVNTLWMATIERARELALLRLVGATRRQVTRMVRYEALAVVGLGLLLGFAAATATLVPLSLAIADTAVPHLPVGVVAGVVVVATLLGLAATALPARAALRTHPAEAIGAPQ